MDFALFVRSFRGVEAVGTGGWGGEADVCEDVDIVDGVVLGGTVRCIGEMKEWKCAVILGGWEKVKVRIEMGGWYGCIGSPGVSRRVLIYRRELTIEAGV